MIFLIAFFIGAWGYCQVGIVNMCIIELSIQHKKRAIIYLILTAFLCEFIYCFVLLYLLQIVLANQNIIWIAKIFTFFVFFGLSIFIFYDIFKVNYLQNTPKTVSTHTLYVAYISLIIHPQQVPFWLLWGTYLIQSNLLAFDVQFITLFSGFVGFGTCFVFSCYAYFGGLLIQKLKISQIQLRYFSLFLMCILSIKAFFESFILKQ